MAVQITEKGIQTVKLIEKLEAMGVENVPHVIWDISNKMYPTAERLGITMCELFDRSFRVENGQILPVPLPATTEGKATDKEGESGSE